MEEKQFHLPDQDNHFISGHALGKLLRRADGDATLVYLYILQQKGNLSVPGAMEALRLSEQAVYAAISVLSTLGLLAGGGAAGKQRKAALEREETPQYTAAEIEQNIRTDTSFSALVKEVGGILGKVLTAPDLSILMGIYHHLGLPPEVIYQLVSHLTREHQEKYGEGKYPTMRGIEKIAYLWARDDIKTLDTAMAHIDRRREQQSQIGRMKKVLDIKQDKLTPTQEKYLFYWLDMGFDLEVIALAYDKTVVATGKLSWNYLNSILTNWHQKNLHTVDAIEQTEGKSRPPGKKPAMKKQTNVPDRQEIARKQQLLDRMDGK
ncbi:MAG: DnaD domain protein [Oscillospiraceae bacterium]|nr:DnaD domain protein [Oscillospiraceae bacterium]